MRIIGEEQLKKTVGADGSENVFVIFGDEAYLKRHYAERIMQKADDGSGFNLQKFDASADLQQVYNAVCQPPFLSDRKCVALCDPEIDKLSDQAMEQLIACVKAASGRTVLLIWFNINEFDTTKSKSKKLLDAVSDREGVIARLDRKQTGDIIGMLCAGAKRRGCSMDGSVARYMVEQCSDDLTNLINELEKLCAFAGEGGVITAADVDRICVRSIDAKAYNLASAITSGRVNDALMILNDLMYINYGAELILGAMASPFTDICRVRFKGERTLAQVGSDFSYGKREFLLKGAKSLSDRLSDRKLSDCIETLVACDRAIKLSVTDERIALEQAVVKLCEITSGRVYG